VTANRVACPSRAHLTAAAQAQPGPWLRRPFMGDLQDRLDESPGVMESDGERPCRTGKPGGVRYLFDCGVFSDISLARIVVQPEEIAEHRLAYLRTALTMLRMPSGCGSGRRPVGRRSAISRTACPCPASASRHAEPDWLLRTPHRRRGACPAAGSAAGRRRHAFTPAEMPLSIGQRPVGGLRGRIWTASIPASANRTSKEAAKLRRAIADQEPDRPGASPRSITRSQACRDVRSPPAGDHQAPLVIGMGGILEPHTRRSSPPRRRR